MVRGQTRVPDGCANIAETRLEVHGIELRTTLIRNTFGKLEDRGPVAGADIEHRGLERHSFHRKQDRAYGIVDKDEVACLPPIAVDSHALSRTEPIAEDRDHAGIRRRRVLSRAKDVEEAQARRRDAVNDTGDSGVEFAAELVRAIA